MSLLASLRLSLESMGFLQLCFAFAALLAYSVALGASFTAGTRAGAGGVAVLSASGFAVAAPEWMAGVVLLMIGVAGVGLFAASTWLLASVFGVASTRGRLAADTPFAAGAGGSVRGRWQVDPHGWPAAVALDPAAVSTGLGRRTTVAAGPV